MTRLDRITVDDLPALTRGAAIFGAGGGGDPYLGGLLARVALEEYGPVPLVTLDELTDDALVVPVAGIGAPTVSVEKPDSIESLDGAVEALTQRLGRRPTHITCIEVGGGNSTLPIVAAARLGIPLLDADGMGRAFPELHMVLPTLYGVHPSPVCMVDEKGNRVTIDVVSDEWAERLARPVTTEMGGSALMSCYPMTGRQARESLVPGSLSRCVEVGAARPAGGDTPSRAVAEAMGGRVLFTGKISDVERATTGGFARGRITVTGLGDDAGSALDIDFQNENLVARIGDRVLATVPDLIVVLDTVSGAAIPTEGLAFGQRVSIIATPADERWHSPGGIALVGARAFGYDFDTVRWDGTPSAGAELAATC